MTDRETKLAHRNILTSLLITTSEQSTRQGFVTDLFLFLLRYPFLLNNASKTQNSRGLKTPQLNVPQGNIYMGARYLDPKYSRWISVDPALAEYIPGAGKSDEADKLPGMGGIYNSVNGNLYHYAGNNPVRYVDPDGLSTKSVLKLIAKYRDTINSVAGYYDVDPVGIASVIFQEKVNGIFADAKDEIAYIIDGGVNDTSPAYRSYGLAEMQLSRAAELLGIDLSKPGSKEYVYKTLMKDKQSIALIAINIKDNELKLGFKLTGAKAGYAHNMGYNNYKKFINNDFVPKSDVYKRSNDFQEAIKDALRGEINPIPDSQRNNEWPTNVKGIFIPTCH